MLNTAIKNAFYRLWLFFKNGLNYLLYPKLIFLELTLFYFYQLYYSIGRHRFEVSQIAKPSIELSPGTTPVANLLPILSKIPNIKKRTFIDVGCGRGLLALSIAAIYKCNVIGLDIMPTYIRVANRLAEREKLANAKFIEGDFLLSDFSNGDIFYITLTCLEDDTILMLAQKLALLRKKMIVITASAPLPPEYFKVIRTSPAYFSWGKGMSYIHKKR